VGGKIQNAPAVDTGTNVPDPYAMRTILNDNNRDFYAGKINDEELAAKTQMLHKFRPKEFAVEKQLQEDAYTKGLNTLDFAESDEDDYITKLGTQDANSRLRVLYGNNDILPATTAPGEIISDSEAQATPEDSSVFNIGMGNVRRGPDRSVPFLGAYNGPTDEYYMPQKTLNDDNMREEVLRHESGHRAFKKLGDPLSRRQEHDVLYNEGAGRYGSTYYTPEELGTVWSSVPDKPIEKQKAWTTAITGEVQDRARKMYEGE